MNLSASIESRPGWNSRIERRIALARAAIFWERLWPRLWPASGILGLLLALSLLDVFAHLPVALHALMLIAAFSAAGYCLWTKLQDFHLPDWADGARRVERESALPHRPITERYDRLAAGSGDALAEALWRAHVRALLARHDRLRFAVPHASLAKQDPHFFRYIVLLLLIAGVFAAGSDA